MVQQKQNRQNSVLPPSWLRFLVIIILVLGIFFRFANLDRKLYWGDECATSLRISGYTWAEMLQQDFDGQVISIEDLQKYQRINPEKGLIDTVKGLATEEPQLPPLYFVIARFWVQWFGNSVAVTRSLSAFISLLVFPCAYWLCLELFDSSLVGSVMISLLAVSPFHVLYAQEARPYSLWTVFILLSSASLLRAMRLKTKLSWGVYALALGFSFYCHALSVLVAIGHGIYVFATEGFRLSKTVRAYIVATSAGLLAFAPWLVAIGNSPAPTTVNWASENISFLTLVSRWLGNLGRIFIDFGFDRSTSLASNFTQILIILPLILILLILTVYSMYFLYRKTPKRVWLFIFTLVGVTALALILPDLILGGRRSSTPRYIIPCYLGVHLAIAYFLTTQITSVSINSQRRRLWQLLIVTLLSGGILSCAISSQAENWWNKDSANTKYYFQVAHIINKSQHPLLISDMKFSNVLPLSYLLTPEVRLLLMVKPSPPKIPSDFSSVFLYKPSQVLQHEVDKEYKLKRAYKQDQLWRIENQ